MHAATEIHTTPAPPPASESWSEKLNLLRLLSFASAAMTAMIYLKRFPFNLLIIPALLASVERSLTRSCHQSNALQTSLLSYWGTSRPKCPSFSACPVGLFGETSILLTTCFVIVSDSFGANHVRPTLIETLFFSLERPKNHVPRPVYLLFPITLKMEFVVNTNSALLHV